MSETIVAARPSLTIVGGAARPAKPNLTGIADAPKAKREKKLQPRAEANGRALIRLQPGEIAAQVDAAQQALIDAEAGVFQRGGNIVQIGVSRTKNFRGEDIFGQSVAISGEQTVREAISLVSQFEKWDARSGGHVPTDCPIDVARTLMQRPKLELPPLIGFVNHPTLRADGSILETEGYDHATGILYDACGAKFASIPENPTYEDAHAAMALFDWVLTGFPFVLKTGETHEANANKSVALSAMLSAVIRRSMGNCPLHGFSAPVRGSGKSTLVDLASILTTGYDAHCTTTGTDETELEKRLASLYLAGKAVIAIDNVSMPLGGDFLNIALSQSLVTPRILGKSEAPTIETCSLVCATGKNLRMRADMGRRAVISELDPEMARPETRQFSFDPKNEMRSARSEFVLAALTILRAWHVAGRPQYVSPIADYEEWSWVRNALVWLHQADPADTMESSMSGDPELEELQTVMSQWNEVIGGGRISCRNAIAKAEATIGGGPGSDPAHPDFREALAHVCARGSVLSTKSLGKWLKANARRIHDGRRFEQVGLVQGIETWALVEVS